MTPKIIYTSALIVLLSACGGGGGGGAPAPVVNPPSTPPPTTPSTPSYQTGVFEASSSFKALCEVPRTGINPETGLAYIDSSGSTLEENHWLRSWSNELYLWYDEIIDENPAAYNDTLSYFDTLKTFGTTPSGADKDKFHFAYDSEEWYLLSQSGVTSGYGYELEIVNPTPPREILIRYVEPGTTPSPAASAGLKRGDKIFQVDGVDVINGNTQQIVNTFVAGLFPEQDGEQHTFQIGALQSGGGYILNNISMTSENVTQTPVLEVDILPGNIGYILFNSHIATAEQGLFDAVEYLDNNSVTDLVLDLRYNGGGYLAIASQMAYMIAGSAATNGRTFDLQQFNDKYTTINPVTGQSIQPVPFIPETIGIDINIATGLALPSLDLNRVFVITGEDTCSASESIINGLRGTNIEVIQIGSTTCGKPYGFYPEDNCGTTYFTIQFSGVNDIGFGDYSDGFSPANSLGTIGVPVTGCSVGDDFSKALGDPQEARLAAALQYRASNSCPTPPSGSSPPDQYNSFSFGAADQISLFTKQQSTARQLMQNKIIGVPAR